MLVLKVRRGEVVIIGAAHVQVLRFNDDWAELGITAPPEWAIDRAKSLSEPEPTADALNSS